MDWTELRSAPLKGYEVRPRARTRMNERVRCEWATESDTLLVSYHDREWGVPVHDDKMLFEFLVLEGAQAGLSWSTILKKRENYRRAFDGFDPTIVARYDGARIKQLLSDPGIVRNALKVRSAIQNARSCLRIQDDFGSLHSYLWSFVDGKPVVGGWRTSMEVPASSAESQAMSSELLKRGFRFVGPTICYAFMQASGMVNDHTRDCFRYRELLWEGLSRATARVILRLPTPFSDTSAASAVRRSGRPRWTQSARTKSRSLSCLR